MSTEIVSTPEQELETFLFQQARLRFCIGEPILTMRDCAIVGDQKRRFPTRFWQITVFAVDDAEQAIDGRRVDLFVHADGIPDILELFLDYNEAIRQVWDARHARCYGFATWNAAGYGSDFKYQEEAEERHDECKAIVQHMRRLLGSRLFSAFRRMVF